MLHTVTLLVNRTTTPGRCLFYCTTHTHTHIWRERERHTKTGVYTCPHRELEWYAQRQVDKCL
uniref:Uncharacterized protein n=1 Tax=Octopus bimaculoides TaxID=37653 RepID=A0A0L8HF13_OCTBM